MADQAFDATLQNKEINVLLKQKSRANFWSRNWWVSYCFIESSLVAMLPYFGKKFDICVINFQEVPRNSRKWRVCFFFSVIAMLSWFKPAMFLVHSSMARPFFNRKNRCVSCCSLTCCYCYSGCLVWNREAAGTNSPWFFKSFKMETVFINVCLCSLGRVYI